MAGLLLPALDRAARADVAGAADLRRDLVDALDAIPALRGRPTAWLLRVPGRGWRTTGGDTDPAFEVFLVCGLAEVGLGGAALRSRRRRLVERWPGDAFDPGTQLAIALRFAALRALLR
ncbi:MAG: hypothetical protein R3F30_03285 [Planctomycetota bacterium]